MAANNILMLKRREEMRGQRALESAFKKADTDGDGKLSVDEYFQVLQDHNIKTTREEIMRLIDDSDGQKGFLTKATILGKKSKSDEMEERAERAFNIMDRNADGYITKQEMAQLTKRLNQQQIDAVFDRNDKDKDGKLSKHEFTEMMCSKKK
eukprot:TRINITY_DN33166_c0_g1_i1.p1 TRINITY_DN33166_c0_g1~~TRINITY_DN33166_c0_g1_i1.p1  ORF type:complete len:152 (-),score=41.69 TRINITY_DN33166_c0_g1_i1:212-667(-)